MLPMGKFALSKNEIANQSSRHYLSLEVGSEDALRLLATEWGADLTAASRGRVCPGAYKPLSAYTVDSEPTTPLMAAAAYGSQRMYGVLLEMGEHFRGKFSMDISRGGEKFFCAGAPENQTLPTANPAWSPLSSSALDYAACCGSRRLLKSRLESASGAGEKKASLRRAARATYECWQGCADVEGLVHLMEELGKIFGVVLVFHLKLALLF